MQPIFNGGQLSAQKRAAEAAYDQAQAQYRATVLSAFQNVADSLRAIQSDADTLRAQAEGRVDRARVAADRERAVPSRRREFPAAARHAAQLCPDPHRAGAGAGGSRGHGLFRGAGRRLVERGAAGRRLAPRQRSRHRTTRIGAGALNGHQQESGARNFMTKRMLIMLGCVLLLVAGLAFRLLSAREA